MRIMEVVTRSDLGGAQSVVINLSNSLCKYHEVIVVAGTEGGGQMGQLLYANVKQEYTLLKSEYYDVWFSLSQK